MAAFKRHLEIVKILLEYEVDVNSRTLYGSTPLSCVVVNNHSEVARLLREKGGTE
jgi:ankyrin repeat protein